MLRRLDQSEDRTLSVSGRKIWNLLLQAHRPTCSCSQWRRDGICRQRQTSVLPPPPIRSVLQSGYYSGFRTWCCEPILGVPFSSVLSIRFPSLLPIFPSLEVCPLNPGRPGERCKLPHLQGLGQCPSRHWIWCISVLKFDIWLQQIYRFSWE